MDFTGRRKSPHPKRILAGGGGTVPLEPIVEMRVGLTSQLHGGNYQLFNLLPPAMGANHLQQELGSQHHPEPIITITKVLMQGVPHIKKTHFKDIVQPKKRRVKWGINRFISTSYTIADAF
jgi:hypothetical protein